MNARCFRISEKLRESQKRPLSPAHASSARAGFLFWLRTLDDRNALNVMACLRSRFFDLALALWTLLFAFGIPFLWSCGSPEAAIRSVTRLWASGVMRALRYTVGIDYVEKGKCPQMSTPYLIVSNHQSMWETIAFLLIFPDVSVIAKEELLRIPIFGWYLRKSPMIVIDRQSGASALRRMIDQSLKAAAAGRSVLVFPEGTRVPSTESVKFRRGVELLYERLGLPVLPVAINSGLYWSPFRPCRLPGRITVSYLDPMEPGLRAAELVAELEGNIRAEARRLSESSGYWV